MEQKGTPEMVSKRDEAPCLDLYGNSTESYPPEPHTATFPAIPATVILGVGNTLLTDEGVGVHVVERLRRDYPRLEEVEFIDGGTLSFTLAGPMAEAEQLIVIDAADLKAAPGTISVFVDGAMDDYLCRGKRRSVHEVSLIDLLAIARLTDSLPPRRALIGIQPLSMEWGEAPSEAVAAAIPTACEMTLQLLRKWQE